MTNDTYIKVEIKDEDLLEFFKFRFKHYKVQSNNVFLVANTFINQQKIADFYAVTQSFNEIENKIYGEIK